MLLPFCVAFGYDCHAGSLGNIYGSYENRKSWTNEVRLRAKVGHFVSRRQVPVRYFFSLNHAVSNPIGKNLAVWHLDGSWSVSLAVQDGWFGSLFQCWTNTVIIVETVRTLGLHQAQPNLLNSVLAKNLGHGVGDSLFTFRSPMTVEITRNFDAGVT